MNKNLLFAIAGFALLAAASTLFLTKTHQITQQDQNVMALWSAFKVKYNKKFADPDFEHYRIQVFTENLKVVESNPKNYGITQFMDLTREEFKQTYLNLKMKKGLKTSASTEFNDAGVEIDWTTKGAVTPVKNQGQCGSCWSFSTTGAVEGALFLSTKKLTSLSEQYLVDCSKDGNQGCNGGLMDTAFEYIAEHGIPTEESYPYKAVDGKCKKASAPYKISSHTDIQDCDDLLNKVQKQPIAIAVDANNFQYYEKDIFSNCGTDLDHGVLLVGYSQKGQYWKVKNSWGTSWGENGYIRLAAGNTCGLCNMASFPNA